MVGVATGYYPTLGSIGATIFYLHCRRYIMVICLNALAVLKIFLLAINVFLVSVLFKRRMRVITDAIVA